jgi:hypothetical protein
MRTSGAPSSCSSRPPVSRRSGPARVTAIPATIAAAAVALGSLAAACGGGSDTNGVAHLGSTQTTTSTSRSNSSGSRDDTKILVAYAACTRKHGVPNFPDPRDDGNGYHLRYGPENGIDPRSSQFEIAQQACRRPLPNGGRPSSQEQARELQETLEYAICMRARGVPSFPDPKVSSDGAVDIGIGRKSKVNPSSPRVKAAETACEHLLPGSGGRTSTP